MPVSAESTRAVSRMSCGSARVLLAAIRRCAARRCANGLRAAAGQLLDGLALRLRHRSLDDVRLMALAPLQVPADAEAEADKQDDQQQLRPRRGPEAGRHRYCGGRRLRRRYADDLTRRELDLCVARASWENAGQVLVHANRRARKQLLQRRGMGRGKGDAKGASGRDILCNVQTYVAGVMDRVRDRRPTAAERVPRAVV